MKLLKDHFETGLAVIPSPTDLRVDDYYYPKHLDMITLTETGFCVSLHNLLYDISNNTNTDLRTHFNNYPKYSAERLH